MLAAFPAGSKFVELMWEKGTTADVLQVCKSNVKEASDMRLHHMCVPSTLVLVSGILGKASTAAGQCNCSALRLGCSSGSTATAQMAFRHDEQVFDATSPA
jgi:hypothetical protein